LDENHRREERQTQRERLFIDTKREACARFTRSADRLERLYASGHLAGHVEADFHERQREIAEELERSESELRLLAPDLESQLTAVLGACRTLPEPQQYEGSMHDFLQRGGKLHDETRTLIQQMRSSLGTEPLLPASQQLSPR
jgi:hypothetical protein